MGLSLLSPTRINHPLLPVTSPLADAAARLRPQPRGKQRASSDPLKFLRPLTRRPAYLASLLALLTAKTEVRARHRRTATMTTSANCSRLGQCATLLLVVESPHRLFVNRARTTQLHFGQWVHVRVVPPNIVINYPNRRLTRRLAVKLNLLFPLSRTTDARKGECIENSKHIFAAVGRFYSQSQSQVVGSSATAANSNAKTAVSRAKGHPYRSAHTSTPPPRYPRFVHGLDQRRFGQAPGWPAIAQACPWSGF